MVNQRNFEEELKKLIFDRLYEIQDKNQEIITKVKTLGKNAGIEAEPCNLGRTATNKLITDIVPQFKKAGLKFYSDSIVSQAIYLQIIDYMVQGNKILKQYSDSLQPRRSCEQEKVKNGLIPSNGHSKFWAMLRKVFLFSRKQKSAIGPESVETAKRYLSEYEDLDKRLWKYNLRDNIIPALTQVICPQDNFIYLPTTVPAIVDEDIEPVLQKLGLGDLIPELEQTLVEEYTKSEEGRIESCISQDEIDLFIPNFERYRAEKAKNATAGEPKTGASEYKSNIEQNKPEIEMETDVVEL